MDTTFYIRAFFIGIFVAFVIPVIMVIIDQLFISDRYGTFKIPAHQRNLPDFTSYHTIYERKQSFISYMLPILEYANKQIEQDRERLLVLLESYASGELLKEKDQHWLIDMADKYQVQAFSLTSDIPESQRLKAWNQLLAKVDIIPISMAMAQAATESAWGTSRFARDGYNLFGQWCYNKGCGIKPKRREEGAIHEVRIFTTIYESVHAYILNLNSNPVYQEMRALRASLRENNEVIRGKILAGGLMRYSQIGKKYIEIIRSVIRQNGLEQYDEMQFANKQITQIQEKDHSELPAPSRLTQ